MVAKVRLALGVAALGGVSALQTAWTGSSALRLAHRAAPGPRLTAPLPRRNLLTPMHMAKSDEALLMGAAEGGRGGAYTSSNPEDRRIKPKDVAGRAKFKVRTPKASAPTSPHHSCPRKKQRRVMKSCDPHNLSSMGFQWAGLACGPRGACSSI